EPPAGRRCSTRPRRPTALPRWHDRARAGGLMSGPLLVALDVDGTLLTYDGELSDATRDAVGEVIAAGHHVVISTGRSVHATVDVWRSVGQRTGWAGAWNGAVTVRIDESSDQGWEAHEVITFDPTFVVHLLAEEFPAVRFAVEDLGSGFRTTTEFPP